MKIKTSELEGQALDWAVAKCECGGTPAETDLEPTRFKFYQARDTLCFSTNWAQGGPIIEIEKIAMYYQKEEGLWYAYPFFHGEGTKLSFGLTPLLAGMRCYVASKLGEEVEIPKELIT